VGLLHRSGCFGPFGLLPLTQATPLGKIRKEPVGGKTRHQGQLHIPMEELAPFDECADDEAVKEFGSEFDREFALQIIHRGRRALEALKVSSGSSPG